MSTTTITTFATFTATGRDSHAVGSYNGKVDRLTVCGARRSGALSPIEKASDVTCARCARAAEVAAAKFQAAEL